VKVFSVIVCFGPDVRPLTRLCDSLLADGSQVVLVDNTEAPYLDEAAFPVGCRLITLGTNTGIAHAQNIGISHAIESAADVIAFFDQDSQVEPGFLHELLSPLNPREPEVVSPLYVDSTDGSELPSLRIGRYGFSSPVHRGTTNTPYAVDIVISSGTAATRRVFKVAGTFDENLFIDFVDTEWCFRCRSNNIPIRVVPSAVMRHRIGSESIKLGIGTLLVHNPTRCYYQLRNCFLLFKKPHIPVLFAMKQALSIFLSRALLLFFVENRSNYVKAYLSALRDGVTGVVGRKPA
jgi:rhamnosyltransferase